MSGEARVISNEEKIDQVLIRNNHTILHLLVTIGGKALLAPLELHKWFAIKRRTGSS
jgi:hypothetical protein